MDKYKHFQLIVLFLAFFIAISHHSFAEIIFQDRRIDWNPGIPGGIPTYVIARNAVTDHGAIGDGVADDTVAIQACINALTANQACYLPAGIYKVTSELTMATNYTALRGEGITSKIISYGTTGSIIGLG